MLFISPVVTSVAICWNITAFSEEKWLLCTAMVAGLIMIGLFMIMVWEGRGLKIISTLIAIVMPCLAVWIFMLPHNNMVNSEKASSKPIAQETEHYDTRALCSEACRNLANSESVIGRAQYIERCLSQCYEMYGVK